MRQAVKHAEEEGPGSKMPDTRQLSEKFEELGTLPFIFIC